ncbi:MAG: hypothetical protein J1E00_02400 [Oscillospiraceae bacterium]|nr:hypothetical protein [Oscillospiraceae bacterium]
MKMIKDTLLEGPLYKILWKRNMLTKIVYILIPFVLILAFGLILYSAGALNMETGYGFLDDYTNCYMLAYIFFFMYFVHGMFLPWLDSKVDAFGKSFSPANHDYYRKRIDGCRLALILVAIGISLFCTPFIKVASETGDQNWYFRLNRIELLYYTFLIICTWIMSAKLFIDIGIQMISLYKYLKKFTGDIDLYNSDKKCGLKSLYNAIAASMGFGVYFILAIGMILYSDYRAFTHFGLLMDAYKYRSAIIAITILLSVIYYAIIIVTYILLNTKTRNQIENKLKELGNDLNNGQVMYLRNISLSVINPNDICIFLLTVLFPGVAALIQILLPFS